MLKKWRMRKQTKEKELIRKIAMMPSLMIMFMELGTQNVYATGSAAGIVQPINLLVQLMAAFVVAMGGYWLVKGVYEWGVAHQDQNVTGQNLALKGIVSGVVCVGVSAILAYLGFTI